MTEFALEQQRQINCISWFKSSFLLLLV
uniref:Uncharacterized protein n=1 Tax=Anguilla anguilla TaxID=7936 RepID=A0A0E9VU26_ANGAN